MQYDFFKENPYKNKEASFNSERYKDAGSNEKKLLYKLFEKLDLFD